MSVPFEKVSATPDIAARATAYDMPGVVVDGMDPIAVYEAVSAALARARRGEGPTLIECKTYRWYGHSARPARTARRRSRRRDRDPIRVFAAPPQRWHRHPGRAGRRGAGRRAWTARRSPVRPCPPPGGAGRRAPTPAAVGRSALRGRCGRPASQALLGGRRDAAGSAARRRCSSWGGRGAVRRAYGATRGLFDEFGGERVGRPSQAPSAAQR